jgi:hypothetical protein
VAVVKGRVGDFRSTYRRRQGIVRQPMEGKDVWRPCTTYGRLIGYPVLKRHDPRHGAVMQVYEQQYEPRAGPGSLGLGRAHFRVAQASLIAATEIRKGRQPF